VRTAWGATGQWKIDTNNSTKITRKILPGRCRGTSREKTKLI